MPDGGEAPSLDPSPHSVSNEKVPPLDAPYILRLGANVSVPSNIPNRLYSTNEDFVSVMPLPAGNWLARFYERLRRDFAQAAWVNDIQHPAAFVDARCVWFRAVDVNLPGADDSISFRVGRARKAHGLGVGLFAGFENGDDLAAVSAPAMEWDSIANELPAWFNPQPSVRWLIVSWSCFMWLFPLSMVWFESVRYAALLAIMLGMAQRLCAALYDGFSLGTALAAPLLEPWFWWRCASKYRDSDTSEHPKLSGWTSSKEIAPTGQAAWRWLDESMFVHVARRLGGSARVMELLYDNRPEGFTWRGRMVDRWIHQTPAARAIRFRCLMVNRLVSESTLAERMMSLPSGTARDLLGTGVLHSVLVDMDEEALRIAIERLPHAETLVGSFADLESIDSFDLFVYCGLSEYLGDKEVVAQLRQIRAILDEDGVLITSTTQPHAQRDMMRKYTGWHTRARSRMSYRGLLDLAGFRVESEWADPHEIQIVFRAVVVNMR